MSRVEIIDSAPAPEVVEDDDTVEIEVHRDDEADGDAPQPRLREVTTMTAVRSLWRRFGGGGGKGSPLAWVAAALLGSGGTLVATSPWETDELAATVKEHGKQSAELDARVEVLEAALPIELGDLPERVESLEQTQDSAAQWRKEQADAEAKREREIERQRQALVRLSARSLAEQRYLISVATVLMEEAGIPVPSRPPIPAELREAEDADAFQRHERWLFGDSP